MDDYSDVMSTARPRSAAFFDLDKTIIAKSSTLAFSRSFFSEGLINRRSVLRSAYSQFVFAISGADHDQLEKMRAYLTTLVAGWDVATVRQAVSETLHDIIDPLVYAEAVDLIRQHQAAGRDVVIVSASGSEVVEPIGELLGVDHVIATTLAEEDGKYTGEITFYSYGPHKAEAMRALADLEGYDLDASFAYSDSETDIPMLEAVGHPFAVNPDKVLRREARERDWPVLTFSHPTELRGRFDHPATRAVAVAGLLGSAGVVAMALARRKITRG